MGRMASVVRDGVQTDARLYDGASRVVQTGPAGTLPQAYVAALNGLNLSGQTLAGTGSETHVNRYDANGRIVRQDVYKSDNAPKYSVIYDVLPAGQVPNIGTAGGYDTAGNLLGYTVVDWTSLVSTNYANTYQRAEGYLQASSIATSSNGSIGGTYWSYGHDGALIDVVDATKPTENRHFVTDMAGTVLYAEQNGQAQRQVVVNGEVLGRYGQIRDEANPSTPGANGVPIFHTEAQFNFGYQPVDGNYPSASPGTYAVSAGDTLQSIARGAYGDEGLWYVIADANGIASNADLKPGTVLTIPAKVGSANNANSFKPYDPTKVVGDTSPNLAQPQGQGGDACGGFGQIIVAAIAVVVAVFVGPEVLPAFEGLLGAGVAANVAAGATAAAAGSVVSQGVGVAVGVQDDFSWQQVGLAAISGGISGGVGGIGGRPGINFTGGELGSLGNRIIQGAVVNALTQGVGVATGLQSKFNWTGVAAAAAGSAVSWGVNEGTGLTRNGVPAQGLEFGTRLAGSTASGIAGGLTTAALRGGRVSATQVAIDAFGNALGDSIASANGQQADPLGDFIGQNQGAWDQRYADAVMSRTLATPSNTTISSDGPTRSVGDQYVDAFGGEAPLTARRSVNPGSVESLRQSDGSYRVEVRGVNNEANAIERSLNNMSQLAEDYAAARVMGSVGDDDGIPTLPTITVTAQRDYDDGSYDASEAARLSNYLAPKSANSYPFPSIDFMAATRGSIEADKAAARKELDARITRGPVLTPIDTAAEARAAVARQRTINNLAGGLGGPLVAAPMQLARMAGLNEYQVQEAGILGMAAQDALGMKGSGAMSAMARGPRGATTSMDYLGGITRSDRMAAGMRFESVQGTLDSYSLYGGRYATQVYVRAFDPDGNLLPGSVRLDGVGARPSGGYGLIDNKLSGNSPFTKNQEVHYPALEQYGGVVTGYRGQDIGLLKGRVLPPTPVDIVRGPLPTYRLPNN